LTAALYGKDAGKKVSDEVAMAMMAADLFEAHHVPSGQVCQLKSTRIVAQRDA